MRLPILNASRPIALDDLTMTQEFRNWTLDASLSIPIVGTGSPEGAVDARQYSLYLDSAGAAGSVSYRKMLPDIGGNRLLGWILT
jgi:hypothetical protein